MPGTDDLPWTCIRRTPEHALVADAELVLTAVAIESRVEHVGGEWLLWVPNVLAGRAAAELEAYRLENRRIPTPPRPEIVDSGWAGVVVYLLVIWMLPTLESSATFGWNWRAIGTLQAGLVTHGEWWRTITTLTLHGSLSHLIANSVFGTVFGLFVGRHLGSGFGWLLVLLSAALGNTLNASLQADGFRSVGASTAVFAALALVATYVWRRGFFRGRGWRRNAAPVFAAIALLAYTGIGGENTDIVAHFTGFFCGALAGILAARFDLTRLGASGQWWCGALAIALVAGAWLLAGFYT